MADSTPYDRLDGEDSTLYDRLGGEDAIAAVVDRFYERLTNDERVAHFFDDIDVQRQIAHQTKFISAVTGGPVEYTGDEMAEAHDHLAIDEEDFEVVAAHLNESLAEFDVDRPDRENVMAEIASYEDDIVSTA